MRHPRIAAAVLLLAIAMPHATHAAEIKVLASGALKAAFGQLSAGFAKSSGDTVSAAYGPAGAIAERARKGEAADVVIATRPQLEALARDGKVVPDSRADIAGIALGVAVRKGAPRPDIATVESFRHALLAARAIGYRDPATGSTSGIQTARMIAQLGLADALKPKTRLDSSPGDRPENVFDAVASGEVELQIGQITEIAIAPGVELAGPLPGALQHVSVLTAGVAAASQAPDPARALVAYLASPAAAAVLAANGFQPVGKQ